MNRSAQKHRSSRRGTSSHGKPMHTSRAASSTSSTHLGSLSHRSIRSIPSRGGTQSVSFSRGISRRCPNTQSSATTPSRRSFASQSTSFIANKRTYAVPKNENILALCLSGTSPEYLDAAMDAGAMPWLKKILSPPGFNDLEIIEEAITPNENIQTKNNGYNTLRGIFQSRGHRGVAAAAFPTLSSTNTVAILAGVPPVATGIVGDTMWDMTEKRIKQVEASDIKHCDAILEGLHRHGSDITIISPTEHLHSLAAFGLPKDNIIMTSVEAIRRDPTSIPSTFSSRIPASLNDDSVAPFTVDLAYELFKTSQHHTKSKISSETPTQVTDDNSTNNNIFYIITGDVTQKKYAPGAPEINKALSAIDSTLQQFDDAGFLIGITSDHGMNDKCGYNGMPRVIYLHDVLRSLNVTGNVILPINTISSAKQSELGGVAMIYLDDPSQAPSVMAHLRTIPGVYAAVGNDDSCRAWDLPSERIGDITVVGDMNSVLGYTESHHDTRHLEGRRLRSNGSMEETVVPIILNQGLTPPYALKLNRGQSRNFDLFDYLLNGIDRTQH